MGRKKNVDATDEMLPKPKETPLSEIGEADGIERVAENDFARAAELESFMAEPVTILVHKSGIESDLEIITPTVNQLNQPIIRGVNTTVKRKYVEALARARTTKLTQRKNHFEPEKITNVETTTLSYPFSVIEDRNPNGRAWLEGILAER